MWGREKRKKEYFIKLKNNINENETRTRKEGKTGEKGARCGSEVEEHYE